VLTLAKAPHDHPHTVAACLALPSIPHSVDDVPGQTGQPIVCGITM